LGGGEHGGGPHCGIMRRLPTGKRREKITRDCREAVAAAAVAAT
jgi:hypothetical protein